LRGNVVDAMQSEPIALKRTKEDLRIDGTSNSTSGKIRLNCLESYHRISIV
jgi:hypothetical protein